ncbi:class II SORL domain-containing protein [Filifactor villosus]|uniref:Class II SORL domain-containing protein n=1 Tax=Filifactor villosus TaxID=29374 RepID=A0ABV9QK89_9FIRM
MSIFNDFIKSGDWKGEKHVPVINCPDTFSKDEVTEVSLSIGDAIAHPNTPEHYIAWFKLFFIPEGGKNIIELADAKFSAHGETNSFSEPKAVVGVKLPSSGKLVALSYCNIHGLWENSKDVVVK